MINKVKFLKDGVFTYRISQKIKERSSKSQKDLPIKALGFSKGRRTPRDSTIKTEFLPKGSTINVEPILEVLEELVTANKKMI